MSQATITKCDVAPCTNVKGEANHWLNYLDLSDCFMIGGMLPKDNPKDCCSEQCLMRALGAWLQKQREAAVPASA